MSTSVARKASPAASPTAAPGGSLWDAVQDEATREALQAPASKPKRHTEWSNLGMFVDGGYLARIARQTCKSCGAAAESTIGIFHVETKIGATDRRLTLLPRGAQWPVQDRLPLEVEESAVDWCAACLRLVGFTEERPAGRDWLKGTVQ